MSDENIRLPARERKKKLESKSEAMYSRQGRIFPPKHSKDVLPVAMDAEVMEQLVKELILKENEERNEEMLESATLPQQSPFGNQ